MGQLAVVFAGRNGLDQAKVRANVIRIPEVSMRIREAQTIIDEMKIQGLDLLSYIMSEDAVFQRNSKLKALSAAIVQVGLFDRFKKTEMMPAVFIGAKGPDSALEVACGRASFKEMIKQSSAFTAPASAKTENTVALVAVPLLAGLPLAEYEAVSFGAQNSATISTDIDPKKLLNSIAQSENVKRVISVGPIPLLSIEEQENLGLTVEDSIHREPALAWFWNDVQPSNLAG